MSGAAGKRAHVHRHRCKAALIARSLAVLCWRLEGAGNDVTRKSHHVAFYVPPVQTAPKAEITASSGSARKLLRGHSPARACSVRPRKKAGRRRLTLGSGKLSHYFRAKVSTRVEYCCLFVSSKLRRWHTEGCGSPPYGWSQQTASLFASF